MNELNQVNTGRRGLLIAGALSATAVAVPGVTGAAQAARTATEAGQAGQTPPVLMRVSLDINGQRHDLELDTRTTLLDALREHLHLTGLKK